MPVDSPRLSVELNQDTYDRYVALLPWGLRGKIVTLLLEDLLSLIEENGDIVLSAIVNRVIRVNHIWTGLPKKEEENGTQ